MTDYSSVWDKDDEYYENQKKERERKAREEERKRLEKENNKYKTEVATAALWNAFPDALNAEFEKHVLGEQNVESKDEES